MKQPIDYPPARREEITDDYHGTLVPDPYRWMEDAFAPETQAWIHAQNKVTRDFLDAVPARPQIEQRLTQLWNYTKYFTPRRKGPWYFYYKNDGLQNQAVLYRSRQLDDEPEIAINPNTLTIDGTAAITSQAISKQGTHLAYGVSYGGSDRQEIRIRNLNSGQDYEEVLRHCRFAGIAWTYDESGEPEGFFYNRDPEPDPDNSEAPPRHNKLYWHRLDTLQEEDSLVYEEPDEPDRRFPPQITEDEQYLVLHVWDSSSSHNRLYYRRLSHEQDPFVRLVAEADARYILLGSLGNRFIVQTNLDAPNGPIVAIDLNQPQRENWRTLVPQGEDNIAFAALAHDRIVVATLHNACHQIHLYQQDGTPAGAVPLPGPGAISGSQGKQGQRELYFKFESFLDPGTVYRYDLVEGELLPMWKTAVAFDSEIYETNQVFYESRDGTRISMFLTYKKGLEQDGNNPVLLYGYGGFNNGHIPAFAAHAIYWIESGGIYADANLRGGNEYGEAWHEAGMLEKKQNVFDDFIAAAAWLVEKEYTRPQKLAIMGRSNGGLLTAACMLQRPRLFGAVLSIVPVTDMLRFHKFTAGRFWTSEYGNAEENAEHFQFLYAYSPLHNVKEGVVYPPLLLTTADGDDRVVPMHAMKFSATLQTAVSKTTSSANPALVRIDTNSGHGLGKPTSKWIEEWADIYAFLKATVQQG